MDITHFAIGTTDVLAIQEKLGKVNYPFCGGHECVGIIHSLGPRCTIREVGERVAVCPIRNSCKDCLFC